MHFIKFSLVLIVTLFSIAAFSQEMNMKFGKIPKEELAMTTYDLDSSAAAVILGDYGYLEIVFLNEDIGYRFTRHRRIKILNRAGFEKGNISIPYYSKGRQEKVNSIKVRVFAPDGTKSEVAKSEIFDEEVNKYWSRKRFTCPNLQVGSVN